MESRIGAAVIAAAVTWAVVRFGAGTVGFKQGLDIELLQTNATDYAAIAAAIVWGLVLILASSQRKA